MKTEIGSCPLCGEGSSSLSLRVRGFTLWKCENCGTLRRVPQMSSEEAERLYRCEYGPRFLPGADVAARRAMFEHLLAQLGEPQGRRLLDLGAGSGLFVRMALDVGWRAEGTELSVQSRDWAKKHHGVTLRDPTVSLPNDTGYDVVSLINVLDQAPDPLLLLRQARKALRSDGVLLVRVPNGSFHIRWSRLASLPGLRRFARLGIIHSLAFTPQSLRNVLHAEGYRIVNVRNAQLAEGPAAGATSRLLLPTLLKVMAWFTRLPLIWGPSLEVRAIPGGRPLGTS